MIKAVFVALTFFSILGWGCGEKTKKVATEVATVQLDTAATKQVPQATTAQIPDGARRIIEAYPDFELSYSDNHIVFPDGSRIVYDDHREKTFLVMMDDCDIEDMFSMTYDRTVQQPDYLADAGRGRSEQLFKKMYGNSEAAARRNLVRVKWFGQSLLFTNVNGAAQKLQEVAAELSRYPELRKYFDQSSTFYWRTVRGAKRQSAHSYGIAIDICTKYSNYWQWSNRGAGEMDRIRYENKIPQQIVDIFEKHGFIWGGRWYHYDTMHFEYRPEFLLP